MTAPSDDEALAVRLVRGDENALRTLHRKYAPLVFSMAAQSLGDAEAEEVVQDTFVTVWKKRESYDPVRGAFRPWLYQIARHRIVNELRRRKRERSLEERAAHEFGPDEVPPVDEARWAEWRRTTVRAAIDALPPAQARALSLAFFEDLSHEQVASMLGIPLGTAKTRIRGGLRRLSLLLAALLALVLGAFGVRRGAHWIDLRNRALRVTTSSDVQPLRMTALAGSPPAAHATFRARAGDDVAVITGSFLPPLQTGQHFTVWMRRGQRWTRLGDLEPNGEGRRLLIAEDASIVPRPDALTVTLETSASPAAPSAHSVVAWP